jgi:hypothetical protein
MAQNQALDDARRGILTADKKADMLEKGFAVAEKGTPGANELKFRNGLSDDSIETVSLLSPKKDEPGIRPPDPIAVARLKMDQEKWDYQKLQDKKPKVASETVLDANGKPVSTRKVSSEVGQSIGKYDAAMDHIARLEKDWLDRTGTFSGLAQYMPGTDASKYKDAQALAAQNIGQIIEGGKLTDSDFDRYSAMMPTAGDSRERAAAKFESLKDYIASRKESSISGAAQAGYDTSGFSGVKRPPSLLLSKEKEEGVAIASTGIQKGQVENGYEFLGGDPGDPKSWKKVGGK